MFAKLMNDKLHQISFVLDTLYIEPPEKEEWKYPSKVRRKQKSNCEVTSTFNCLKLKIIYTLPAPLALINIYTSSVKHILI